MRSLLVPTDFSLNAYKAAHFAANIASRIETRLVVFHTLAPMYNLRTTKVKNIFPEAVAQRKLDEWAYELRERYNISVSRLLKPGFAADEISTLAERLDVTLIVMAVDSDQKGNIATEVCSCSRFPVVCVPAGHFENLNDQIRWVLNKQHHLCNTAGYSFLTALVNDPVKGKI